jgi:hypothetical protein
VNLEVPREIAAGQSGISSVQVGAAIEMAQTDVRRDFSSFCRSRAAGATGFDNEAH